MNNEKMSELISALRKKRGAAIRKIAGIGITGAALIGIVVCAICNIAINGALTWSLYPIISVAFAWAIVMPMITFQQRGILASLILLSVLLIPFLISIGILSGYQKEMNAIGVKTAIVGMIYIWAIYILQRIMKRKRLIASAISVLMALPVNWLINWVVDSYTKMNGFNIWDIITSIILVFIALILVIISFASRRKILVGTN